MPRILPVLAVLLWLTSLAGAAPVINEVQSTNNSLPDQYGQLMDWVEIHNPTGAALNLQGYYLSDSTSSRTKFTFPAGTMLAAGQFLIVWCGQAAEFTTTGPYPPGQVRATNFNISSGGEPIVLTAPDASTTVDEFPAQAIGAGRTLGRGTGANFNTLFFYDSPTFGSANTTTGTPTLTLEPPLFSLPAGIYTNGSLSVAISLPGSVPSGVIRYTLDGSEPTTNSPVYGGPLTLNASTTTNNNSYIPTNLDGNPGPPLYEGWQPPASQPFRINVLRARVFAPGAAGRVQTASYLQHSSGTNRYTMPVVSVATDPANMFSDERGIYVPGWSNNMFQEGSAWERPGNIEFFEPDGSLAFAGTIGLRLHGNTTRSRPRKSLRIYARNPYGESTFRHRIFPQKEISRFDTFLLRNGGNDWGNSLFRDALVTTLAEPTGLDIQSSRPAAVFISGEYWGIHNLRDRIDEGYFFNHYGLGTTSFSQIEVIPTGDSSTVVADNGSTMGVADFEDLLNRAASTGFVSDTNYAHLASRIDIDNYIDYNAFEIWSGNTDWPGNNYRLWRSVTADTAAGANPRHDGRWRWILFDTDFGLGADFEYVIGHNSDVATMAQFNSLAHATSTGGEFFSNKEPATRLLRKALENSGFRNKFINRFADLLNSTLSASSATAKLDQFVALYSPGVAEHVNRWRQPYNWSNDIARIRTYMQQRPAAVRGHIAGQFGLSGTANLTVNVANTNQGAVTVNTLSIDPATAGVGTNAYPWTGTYFRGVPVTVTAVPKPGYRFVSWSNSVSAGPSVVASDAAASYGSWTSGANGGTGFGPWSLNTSTGNRDRAGTFLDNPRGGWGLYANEEHLTWVYRSLSNALQVGQTFAVRVKHGSVDWPGDVGFELANSNGGILFKMARPWWSDNYVINDTWTTIPATTSPLDIEVTLVTSNSYSARITPVGGTTYTNTGTLLSQADRAVRRFTAFNYSAGNGGGADVFVTSMQVTAPSGGGSTNYALFSTNATITPSLTNASTFLATFAFEAAVALAITPPVWTAGFSNAPVSVRAVNSLGDTDTTFSGTITLTLTGPGGVLGTYTAAAVDGVATFAAVDLPAGSYTLTASAGSLSTAAPVGLTVRRSATFLPAGSGVWHSASNWDSGAVPNSPAVSVIIPPNTVANRDVTNNAPTTVAAVTFELGASAFRNRITGTDGQPFTLASTSGISTVTVTGTGAGHANIEVPGGAVFSNQVVLDVQNTGSTNAEYGALRLQGAVSGPGAIIKRGPGMAGITGAGKTFSGGITIEQGVLTFSEPAITANGVTNYTVQAGGQLRLSSAGNPRNYLFKGPLNLAGSGRSGVPDNENLGVLGALRLETGSTGTVAVLSNNLHLAASADIHVPAGNAIRLDGPLTAASNTDVLAKSGGGTLTLSSAASTFTGGLAVHRGTLQLGGVLLTNTTRTLVLTNETTLTGTGRWGGGLQSSAGATISFSLGASPAGSAALRVASAAFSGSNNIVLETVAETAPGAYPLLAVDGSFTGTNQLRLAQAPPNYPAASLSISNGTLFAVLPAGPAATALSVEVAAGGSGLTLPDITVRAVNPDNIVDTSFTGTVTLTITGPNSYLQTYTAPAAAGVAVFTGITVPAAGAYAISSGSGALSTTSGTDITVTPPPVRRDLLAWRFNAAATLLQPDTALVAGGSIATAGGLSTEFYHNAAAQGFADGHFRVDNPHLAGKSVTFSLPTTGYDNIRISYDTRRSGTGSPTQKLSVRTAENGPFAPLEGIGTITVAEANPQPIALDLTGLAGAADNPHFALRIEFEGGTGGNNRFDNFMVSGTAVPGPPQLDPSALPAGPLVAGGQAGSVALSSVFTDNDSPSLSYAASSSRTAVATVSTAGDTLVITPVGPGETVITVSAEDGDYPAVGTSYTLLVYPAAHALGSAAFTFGEWSATSPAMTFPANMIFLQSEVNDPGLATALPRAYQIPLADASAPIDAEQPYNAIARTRINGLGNDGIAFINTGRGRDVGAALVALDTTGVSAANLSFTAGTVLANTRVYAIRLQYRVGASGDFTDVTDGQGSPIEYLRNATNGHSTDFGPIALPEGALGQPYVQLLWRYYFVSGASGARAQLRLDNLNVQAAGGPDNRETWLAQYGLPADGSGDGADTADPDGDGIPNIFERAMFLDPTSADSTVPAALGDRGGDTITFTYRVAKAQDDLTVGVVATTSLTSPGPWSPLASTVVDETNPDYTIYRVELPTSANAGFLRLEVTR